MAQSLHRATDLTLEPLAAPVVSIIIPAFRVAGYIAATLDSILAQTFSKYEIIVVDDGSPDSDQLDRVLAPYRAFIRYIRQDNQGVSSALNAGIGAARAQILAFLGADDLWEPTYLAEQLAILDCDPTIDVLCANWLLFGNTSNPGRPALKLRSRTAEVTFEPLIRSQCVVLPSATLVRRDAVVRAGMFDPSLRSSEDYDLWIRMLKQGSRIVYQSPVLVRYRVRPGSLSADAGSIYEHGVRVLDKSLRTLALTPTEARIVRRESAYLQAKLQFSRGKRAFYRQDFPTAVGLLTDANRVLMSGKVAVVLWALRLAPHLLFRTAALRDAFVHRTGGPS